MPATRKTGARKAVPKSKKSTTPPRKEQMAKAVEEMKVVGGQLVEKIKELIKEGNVRRIVIKQRGRVLLEIPVTLAVVGVAFAPILAAVGALAALVSDCTLEVERDR